MIRKRKVKELLVLKGAQPHVHQNKQYSVRNCHSTFEARFILIFLVYLYMTKGTQLACSDFIYFRQSKNIYCLENTHVKSLVSRQQFVKSHIVLLGRGFVLLNSKELLLSPFLEICITILKENRSQIEHVIMNTVEKIYTPLKKQFKTIKVFFGYKTTSNVACKIHKSPFQQHSSLLQLSQNTFVLSHLLCKFFKQLTLVT